MKAWVIIGYGCLECMMGPEPNSEVNGIFWNEEDAKIAYEEFSKNDSGQYQTDMHEVEITIPEKVNI